MSRDLRYNFELLERCDARARRASHTEAATNGGAKSKTLFTPSVIVVPFSHARQPHALYSAVDTGITFLSLLPVNFPFLPSSLAFPGTSFCAADAAKLNV